MAEVALAPEQTQNTTLGPGIPTTPPAGPPTDAQNHGLNPDQLLQLGHSTTTLPLSDAVTVATQSAPQLDPASVVTIAQTGGDVQQKAEVVAMAKKTNDVIDAATEVAAAHPAEGGVDEALSWLGHNVIKPVASAAELVGKSPIGKGLSDVANVLNLPLNDVQHEWRYLHDVEARHGLTAAVAEGLAISAGVIGGSVLGGPDGAILGGEGAAQVLGGIMYHDSWTRTANGATYKDPNTGNVVSFGRDISSLLVGQHSKPFGTISGVVDGIADLILDPFAAAGKLKAAASSVEGGTGLIMKHWGGLGLTDPDLIDRADDTNPAFHRAVDQLRAVPNTTEGVGWIAGHYPKLIPIAQELAAQDTREGVLEVLKNPVLTANLLTDKLPTMSFAGSSFQKLRDAMANYEGPLANNFFVGPARMTRRFSKVTGSAFDEMTKTFSGRVIDPDDARHAEDIYRFVRYTQNERVAEMAAAQWIESAPGQRIILFRNLIMDNIAHAAHFHPAVGDDELLDYAELMDPSARSAMKIMMDHWTGGGDPGMDGVYGLHNDGSTSAKVYDNNSGKAWAAAVLENQTGKLSMPSFSQIKTMGKQMRVLGASNAFARGLHDVGYFSGKLDQFAYDAIVARFFKPLVLMSGSYAWHISLAEAIPNSLRMGLLNTVRVYARQFNGRLGYDALEKEDPEAILGTIVQGFGDDGEELSRMKTSERQLRLEAETIMTLRTEGHRLTRAASSAENYSKEYHDSTRMRAALRNLFNRVPEHGGDDFSVMERGRVKTTSFLNDWRDAIREANASPASRAALGDYIRSKGRGVDEDTALYNAGRVATQELKKMDPDMLAHYQRSKLYSSHWHDSPRPMPPNWQPVDDWGQEVAHNMRSLLGRGEPNSRLAEHMMYGTTPSTSRLQQIFDGQDTWPVAVKGRVKIPGTSGVMSNLADVGFKYAINPFVDYVSRQPLFRHEFTEQWRQLRPLVQSGVYDIDEAANIALDRASTKVLRFVHNLHDRSQVSETLRNWLPFYFAQEQAYRRMGRLLVEDPGAFRRYQMMISAVAKMVGTGVNGTNGEKYYLIPGGTWLSEGAQAVFGRFGLPLQNVDSGQLQTSLSSANVIFPLSSGFRPDLSPVAALAAKSVYALFPQLGPKLSALTGTQTLTDPIWTMFVPNTAAQRLLESLPVPGVGQEYDRSFVSSMNQAIQFAAYEQTQATYRWIENGSKGPPPQIIPVDSIAGDNAQGGIQQTVAQQNFINRIKNQTMVLFLTNMMVSFFSPVSTTPAINDFGFTNEVNQDIAKAGSVTKGVQEFLLKNPLATPYTVWQSYSPSGASLQATQPAQDWINAHQSFITKYPSVAFFMMPKTNGQYDYSIYNEQLAQGDRVKRSPQEFLNSIYVSAGNIAYYNELDRYESVAQSASGRVRSAAYNAFNSWINAFSATHPIWAALGPLNDAAKDNTMRQGLSQIQAMVQTNEVPNNPEARQVVEIYNAYQMFNERWLASNSLHNYSEVQRTLKQGWRAYLQAVEAQNPDSSEVISTLFSGALGITNQG